VLEDGLGSLAEATGRDWSRTPTAITRDAADAPEGGQFIGLAAKRRRLVFFFACMCALMIVLLAKTDT